VAVDDAAEWHALPLVLEPQAVNQPPRHAFEQWATLPVADILVPGPYKYRGRI
jgi:hypothetical protein